MGYAGRVEPPGITWVGMVGISTASLEGAKRCGGLIFVDFKAENIY